MKVSTLRGSLQFNGLLLDAIQHFLDSHGVKTPDAFVESLNGKFRNECLNQHWFRIIEAAEYEINKWRYHYNHVRPHSSLNYLPPVVFARQAA